MRLRHRVSLRVPGDTHVRSSGKQLSLVAAITGLLLASQVMQPGPVRAAEASAAVEPAAVVAAAPSCSDLDQYALNDLNERRQSHGLPDYQFDQSLATAACAHTALLWDNSPTNGCPNPHQCPGEPDPPTRMSDAGASFTAWGENVGNRWAIPSLDPYDAIRAIHDSFMAEGPGGGHYENMMSTQFQRVGIAVVSDEQHLWMTQDFAD
jgi:uncharacterized protein YkwD